MKQNPFRLDFGAEPGLYIPRYAEQQKLTEVFRAAAPPAHIYLILGARGTGKTVLMTAVSHKLKSEKNWLHVDLNAMGDLLNALAARIYRETKGKFPKIKLQIAAKGLSLSLEKEDRYNDIESDLDAMLKTLHRHHIRVLITVDEVSNTKNIRQFTNYFQHCLREELPVFVLMTGLYKNIRALQNNRSQTFLRRAPKIDLLPLNLERIAQKYGEVFTLNQAAAFDMAKQTAGYSFAFQLLGYLTYESGKNTPDDAVLTEYRISLAEASYEKIWEEFSAGERNVASAIARFDSNARVRQVREELNMDSNTFSTYRDTLQKSGVLSAETAYGCVNFCLPYFREFVLRQQG